MSCGNSEARDLVLRFDKRRLFKNKERIDKILGLTMATTYDAADIMYALAEFVLKSLNGEELKNIGHGPSERLLALYAAYVLLSHEKQIADNAP